MINLIINGESKSFDISDNAITLSDLITELNYTGKRIAVELNGEIAPKSKHQTITLKNNDTLEIITAVGGG